MPHSLNNQGSGAQDGDTYVVQCGYNPELGLQTEVPELGSAWIEGLDGRSLPMLGINNLPRPLLPYDRLQSLAEVPKGLAALHQNLRERGNR